MHTEGQCDHALSNDPAAQENGIDNRVTVQDPNAGDQKGRVRDDDDSPAERLVEEPSFETMLDTVGHFGRFQVMIFVLLTVADIMNAMNMMYLVFAPATPRWRCAAFEGENATLVANGTLQNESFVERCEYNETRCTRFDFDKDYTSIVTEWDLVCEKKYVPKMVTSILMFGVLIGTLGAAQLSDLYGRRMILCVSLCLSQFLITVVGLSVSWQMYATLRFLNGIFLGATICLCYIIPMEFIGPKWRSTCGALGIWDLGSSLTALAAFLLHNWRHLAFVSGALFLPLVLAIIILIPESVRWLIQKRRFAEAKDIIRRMAEVNNKPVPDLDLLEQISRRQNAERAMEARYTYLDLFSTVKLASRTLVVMFCWFTASIVLYGIVVSVSDLSGNMYLNTVYMSLPGMFLGWTVIPMANWLGRKRTYYLYITVPIASMFGIVILNATGMIEKEASARTALAIIGKITIAETWTVASLISSEIYPTLMRAIGVGIGNVASRIAGIIAPQIVLLGDLVHWTLPYIINGCLAVVSVILVALVFPETRGEPLPEDAPPAGLCLKRLRCKSPWKRSRKVGTMDGDDRNDDADQRENMNV